jgi:hypothetical protein
MLTFLETLYRIVVSNLWELGAAAIATRVNHRFLTTFKASTDG